MAPTENTEEVEHDGNYRKLVDELTTSRVSRDEAFHLHMWLSDQMSERAVQRAIATAVGTEAFAEQIRDCTKLETYASAIAERFDFLRQVSSLEVAMSRVFEILNSEGTSNCQLSPARKHEHWCEYRDRLAADIVFLAQIAQRTSAELKTLDVKKGRPTKDWRNYLFTALVVRLRKISGQAKEECIELARCVWNIYFDRDKIMCSEAAGNIVTRELKRQKLQGQNAP